MKTGDNKTIDNENKKQSKQKQTKRTYKPHRNDNKQKRLDVL